MSGCGAFRIAIALSVLVLAAAGLGCASSSIRIELALYGEDPRFAEALSPEDVIQLNAALQDMVEEANQLTMDRIGLANSQFDLYATLWLFVGGELDDISELREQLERHDAAVQGAFDAFVPIVEDALRKLSDYVERYKAALAVAEGQATRDASGLTPEAIEDLLIEELVPRSALNRAKLAFRKLSAPPRTDFALGRQWQSVERSLSPRTMAVIRQSIENPARGPRPAPGEFERRLDALRAAARRLATRAQGLAKRHGDVFEEVSASIDRGLRGDSEPSDMARRFIGAAARIPRLDMTSGGQDALTRVVQNSVRTLSQIDRLQDAGDPAWRVVTARENARKWNTEFSKTYFHAQGNAGVMIVRDNPMTFRVQRGYNNPAALVRGQLQVSRAVGDAAITIAGAATGVPTGALTSLGSDGAPVGPSSAAVEGAQSLVERRATARKKAVARASALKILDRNLQSAERSLSRASPSQLQQELRSLQSLLKAATLRFAPKTEDTP